MGSFLLFKIIPFVSSCMAFPYNHFKFPLYMFLKFCLTLMTYVAEKIGKISFVWGKFR